MNRAFTVLELMIVIAIIGLISAILLPVFAGSKLAAHRAVSISNVKQITLAQFLYLDDNDGAVAINRDCHLTIEGRFDQAPCRDGRAYRGWIDLTVPYVRNYQVFKSPADDVEAIPLPEGSRDSLGNPIRDGIMWGLRPGGRVIGGEYRTSYARNNNWSNNGTYTARFFQAEHPSTLILIYSFAANSGAGARAQEGVTGSSFTIVRRPNVQANAGTCVLYNSVSQENARSNFFTQLPFYAQEREAFRPSSERYGGRAIYGFTDGHAKALPPEAIRGQCGWGYSPKGVEMGNDGIHPDFRF
ncbi:MAG: type II secretion system protein [Fimbriimonadaceae bacterium]|nr:type II secretion system protein [Fimbriimonadaceae bacterium]